VWKRTLGDEHPDTLTSMNNLALRYSDVGRTKEALQLTEETLTVRKRTLGDEHPDTLTSMSNLALSYWDVGRTKEALQLTAEALTLRTRMLGDEHPHTLQSMKNLQKLKQLSSDECVLVPSQEKRSRSLGFRKLFRKAPLIVSSTTPSTFPLLDGASESPGSNADHCSC
jgi:hypothetical protein